MPLGHSIRSRRIVSYLEEVTEFVTHSCKKENKSVHCAFINVLPIMYAKNAKQRCTSQYRDTLRGIRVRLCGKGALDSKLCMTLMELQGKLPASHRGCNKLGQKLAEKMFD